jgi:hypothetical protein
VNRREYNEDIFRRFARAACLTVDWSTLDLDNEPDIRCQVQNELVGYELTAATDGFAEQESRRGNEGSAFWFRSDVANAAFNKMRRGYSYDLPSELIVHEGAAPLLPRSTWIGDLDAVLNLRFSASGFRRVWVVNPWKEQILFVQPPQ